MTWNERLRRYFALHLDGHRVMCPYCKTWWDTDSEAAACLNSHYGKK
jgi:hypothetical protein